MVRFLHTADWQLGMTRSFLSEEAQGRFTQARIDAIRTMADFALKEDAKFGVVAGDVFESNLLSPQVISRSLEAMRASQLPWYLLPGNHDPLDASSIYRQRAFLERKPDNVHVIADNVPIPIDTRTELVGAPWPNKRPLRDLVDAAVRDLQTASGKVRVAVGHGAIDILAPDKKNPANICFASVQKAFKEGRIQYLALGDRHSSTIVGGVNCVRYSGAPEPTDYDEKRPGLALLVDLNPEKCEVRELPVARWRFARETVDLSGDADLPRLQAWFNAFPSKENTIVKLGLKGALSLRGHAELESLLEEEQHLLGALERWERESQLSLHPTPEDLDALGLTGYAQKALEDLQAKNDGGPESREVGDALALLYRLAKAGPAEKGELS